jgi:hypothetical protein
MTPTLLKELAARTVAQYPQYANHFDGYVAVRIKRDIRTKMGLAFQKGEIAIGRPAAEGDYRTVWSAKNKVDTSVRASHVEVVS